MPLFAVTVPESDLQHAAPAGSATTLCGADVPSTERVHGRFPAVRGTLCGTCVDAAFVPDAAPGRPGPEPAS